MTALDDALNELEDLAERLIFDNKTADAHIIENALRIIESELNKFPGESHAN